MAYAVKQGIQDLVLDLISVGAPIPDYIDGIPTLAIVYGRGQMDLFQHLIVHGADTDIAIDGKTLWAGLSLTARIGGFCSSLASALWKRSMAPSRCLSLGVQVRSEGHWRKWPDRAS